SGPSRRIDVERLEYWNSLDVPVLIAYLVVETGQLFGRWAHTIGREPGSDRQGRTTTLRFAATDLLHGAVERLASDVFIVRELRAGRVPLPLPVRVTIDGAFTAATQAEVIVRLRSLLRNLDLREVVEVLPGSDSGEPAVGVLLAQAGETVLRVALPVDVASVRVAFPAGIYEGQDNRDLLACDVLVAVAIVLSRTGATSLAARLLAGTAQRSLLSHLPDTAEHLAGVMDEHGLVDEALSIALHLWGSDDQHLRDVADVYYSPVLWDMRRISSDGRDVLVAQMRSRADAELSSTNPRRAGRAYYNLAQTLNALGRTGEAVDCLNLALAYDPGYAHRDYFFRERGGFQWSLDRYAAAADDYQSALNAGADPSEVTPLLADALLYAGRYERALSVLTGWSPTGHDLDRLAALDILAVGELIRVTGVAEQNRRQATTEEIAAAADDTTLLIELLRSTDALDPRIWIQLIDDSSALSRTVLVALVSLNSSLAWAIATATVVEDADAKEASLDTVHHIVDSAVRLTQDDEYTEAIEQVLVDADREFANRVRTVVYERMQALRDRPPPHTTRVIIDPPDIMDGPQCNAGS
ncbi:MAG: hypothetical protein LC799_05900, partial [Actinobacteria bacterium]|nr:hypothetical protein [Actinomycetota bacterium]